MPFAQRFAHLSPRPLGLLVSRVLPAVVGVLLLVIPILAAPAAGEDAAPPRVVLTFDHGADGLYTVTVAAGQAVEAALADGRRLRVVPRPHATLPGRVEVEVTPIELHYGTARPALEQTRFLAGQTGFPEHLAEHGVILWIDRVETGTPRPDTDPADPVALAAPFGLGDPVAPASDCQCCVTCDDIKYCAWAVRTPCGSCQCKDGILY